MSETQQHIGWLKQYLGAMTAENWKDMRDLAIRQVDDLARTPAPDAVREALEPFAELAFYSWLQASGGVRLADQQQCFVAGYLAAISKPAGGE